MVRSLIMRCALIVAPRKQYQFLLASKLEGKYKCLVAENGKEALKIFQKDIKKIKLVITDDELQPLTEVQFISCIRQIEKNYSGTQQPVRRVPVILLTDKNSGQLSQNLRQLNVENILSKPLKDDELNTVLQKLAEQETLNTVLMGQVGQQMKKPPELSREQINKIVAIEGNAGGTVFLTDAQYIQSVCGAEGVAKVNRKMKELGYQIAYEKIRVKESLPLGLRALSFHVIKQVLNWDNEQFRTMGFTAPRFSMIMKFLLQHFVSLEKMFKVAPKLWEKHYDVGKLIPKEIDIDAKQVVIALEDFHVDRLYCEYLMGYFSGLLQHLYPKDTIKAELTKATASGDSVNEFRIYSAS